MNTKNLIFGLGQILREQVDGWATSGSGTPHVYPDHPGLDLAKSEYPRATIDTIGFGEKEEDIEKEATVGDVLVDITVYSINSRELHEQLSDSLQAIVDYHDQTDSSGDLYLEDFALMRFGVPGPIIDEQTTRGFTRFNKTQEVELESVTVKTV